jgi:hypothetical protein
MVHLDFVSQEASQTSESFQKLRTFWRLVSYELDLAAKVFVMD